MPTLDEFVALKVNELEISLGDVLRLAKANGAVQFVQEAIDVALIRQAAVDRGLSVSDDELQQAADEFRAGLELFDEERTQAWLAARRLSYEEAESVLADRVLTQKLREALVDDKIEQHFTEQRLFFDGAAISRLVVSDEGIARELRAQIVEDDADFHALARAHSIDLASRPAGGYVGLVHRADLDPAVEVSIFGAEPGKIFGPLKTDDGWELLKLESRHPAILDDEMRETIKSQLFAEWLSEQRRKANVSIPLLNEFEE